MGLAPIFIQRNAWIYSSRAAGVWSSLTPLLCVCITGGNYEPFMAIVQSLLTLWRGSHGKAYANGSRVGHYRIAALVDGNGL